MRRMWTASAAIVAFLTLSGVAALAQSPEPSAAPSAWAAVSATSTCSPQSGGTAHLDAVPYTVAGMPFACNNTATDPRVAGPGTMTYSAQTWDERSKASDFDVLFDATAWLEYVVTGPDGTWTGDGYGVYDDAGALHLVAILAGNGAYEGLIFSYSGTVPVKSLTAELVGVIQPGSLPPDFPVGVTGAPSPSAAK